MRIAIVEDDPSQLELVWQWLDASGHEGVAFQNAPAFLNGIRDNDFELLLLDWNLGEFSGLDLLSRIRQTSKIPVLFCTSRGEQDDAVKALRAGADDYLIKPLGRLELLARIEAVARRARKKKAANDVFEANELRVDCESRTITRDGAAIE